MADKSLQFYRGPQSGIPTLKEAEPGWTTDEKRLYVGDGTSNVAIANKSEVDAVQNDLDTLEVKSVTVDTGGSVQPPETLTGPFKIIMTDEDDDEPETGGGLTQEQADQRYLQKTGGTVTGDVTIKRPDVNIDIVPTYIKAQVVPDGGPTFIVSNEFSSIKLNTGSGSAFITEHGSAVTGLISVTGDASHSGNVDQMFAVGVYDGADTQDIQEILANSKGMLIVQGEEASLGGIFEGITMLGPIQFSGNQLSWVGEPTASSDAATKMYVDNKVNGIELPLAFGPKTVASSAWAANATYSAQGYGFRASVPLSGVTADHIPDVTFAMADAVSGNLAPLADTYAGGIYIYAKEQPSATVNIASVVCTKGA